MNSLLRRVSGNLNSKHWQALSCQSLYANIHVNKQQRILYQTNSSTSSTQKKGGYRNAGAMLAMLGLGSGVAFWYASKNKPSVPRVFVVPHAKCAVVEDREKKPEKQYSLAEVAQHKSDKDGIWVTYDGGVYDITQFAGHHPAGKGKIMLAAGGALEPYWDMYPVHKSDSMRKLLEKFRIGSLKPEDIAAQKAQATSGPEDRFKGDPKRHPALKVVSQRPFNAETPAELLADNALTPNEIFFVRNHFPVPKIDPKTFRLAVEAPSSVLKKPLSLSLTDLRRFPAHSISATVMCTGNRRTDMSAHKPARGLEWDVGAISTAQWRGVWLRDLLAHALNVPVERITPQFMKERGIRHVLFEGLDKDETGQVYGASVPVELALDPAGDALVAYEMNGTDLPPDHGYPLRIIVPGIVGARQVKWLGKISLSAEESTSFFQKQDYKTFSPSRDYAQLDYNAAEPIMESCLQSAICVPGKGAVLPDDGVITVKGYAWSGGGRGILRVEVSVDGGETWVEATREPVTNPGDTEDTTHPRLRRQWGWTLWEADVPVELAPGEKERKVEIICKAVDTAQNSQPESYKGTWNVRGLMANAYHKTTVFLRKEVSD